jgi:hypothetical protein
LLSKIGIDKKGAKVTKQHQHLPIGTFSWKCAVFVSPEAILPSIIGQKIGTRTITSYVKIAAAEAISSLAGEDALLSIPFYPNVHRDVTEAVKKGSERMMSEIY